MGSCFSGGSVSRNPKKKQSLKKSKEYIGCFGSLCKGQDNMEIDNKASTDVYPMQKIQSTFIINHNNDELNNNISKVIFKYKDSFNIEKINYEQLYNLFMNYVFDFTNCNFVIADTRKGPSIKKQYFLHKFPQVNYTMGELSYLNSKRQNNFLNYIKNKTIIFILTDLNSLETVEKYLLYLIPNNMNKEINILILTQFLEQYNESKEDNSFKEYLYYFIEEDRLYEAPSSILINTKDIKSSYINNQLASNNSYVFVKKFTNNNKFDINYLCDKDIDENDIYFKFIVKNKISYLLNISISQNKDNKNKINQNINYNEAKRNKMNNEEKKTTITQINVLYRDDIDFDNFFDSIKNELNRIIDELRNQIVMNNCILLQFNENIEDLIINKFIFYIANKITGLSFEKLIEYFKCNNCVFLKESIVKDKKEEIAKMF